MAKKHSNNPGVSSRRPEHPRRVGLSAVSVDAVQHELAQNAATILKHTHESAIALLDAYELTREKRQAPTGTRRGTTTDADQDVLRAMLVMAAAGIDGMAKQLIRDSMPALVNADATVREGLEKFALRQIQRVTRSADAVGTKFLARVLAAQSQQKQVIEEYIRELTGGSLQSADELMRVAGAFGCEPRDVKIDPPVLKEIFEVRNRIIHELDIDLTGDRRKRTQRTQGRMTKYVDTLLSVGLTILTKVDRKLRSFSSPKPRPNAA